MKDTPFTRAHLILAAGDILALWIVTLFGFASHNALGSSSARWLTTFLPLLAGWILIAPHLQNFRLEVAGEFRELWRPAWAAVLSAPIAGLLRSLWLGTLIVPVFVLVLAGVGAAGMLAWRFLYVLWWRRKGHMYG